MEMPCGLSYLNKTHFNAARFCFFAGVVVHAFTLTNVLHNYDDIAAYPVGFGTGISSGRWFLEILNRFFISAGFAYNLTYINALLFIFLISLSSLVVVSVLNMKGRISSTLIGFSFVVFPTAVSILFFRFTSHIYGLAVLFSVVAVWVFDRFRGSIFVSALLIALSLGIYQAYYSLTASLFILMLIKRLIRDGEVWHENLKKGLCYLTALILGLIIYFAALHFCLIYYGTELSGYQGIGNTSSYTFGNLPSMIKKAISPVLFLPFRDYCGITNISFLRKAYLAIEIADIILLFRCVKCKKSSVAELAYLSILLCALLLSVNLIALMGPDSEMYTMMAFGFITLLWLPLILVDIYGDLTAHNRKNKLYLNYVVEILAALVVVCYSYQANINYSSMYFATQQAENYMNAVVNQVISTDGYTTDKRWAFIGSINDPLLEDRWALASRYGGNVTGVDLVKSYSRYDWIRTYFGYYVPFASSEESKEIQKTEDYKKMTYWPEEGSIKIIGDVVVIKFSEQDHTS